MSPSVLRCLAIVTATLLAAAGVAARAVDDGGTRMSPAELTAGSGTTTTKVTAAAPTPAPSTTTATVASTTTSVAPTTTVAPAARLVTESGWSPFATVEGVVLFHPAQRVERVGFHQSNHDGARQLAALSTTVRATTLEDRERGTGSQTAADVVIDPGGEVRSPVTGVVKRAGTYVLYCDYSDDYVVIEPDSRPGWEVKVLHIDGVRVRAGERVVAGETVIAPRPTQLSFESQVDELRTADPAWPHVHIEVVDPSIPDRPSPGGGCN